MPTSIRISDELLAVLKKLQDDRNLRSYEDVLRFVLQMDGIRFRRPSQKRPGDGYERKYILSDIEPGDYKPFRVDNGTGGIKIGVVDGVKDAIKRANRNAGWDEFGTSGMLEVGEMGRTVVKVWRKEPVE